MQSIPRVPSVYQIRHIESGRVYVGSSVDPRHRWSSHRSKLSKGLHDSSYLQRAWDKYGASAFVFEIIESALLVEDLIAREQYWIDALRAADSCYGFNMAPVAGSVVGIKRTDETRMRLSVAKRAEFSEPAARSRLVNQSRAYWANPESHAKARIKQKVVASRHETRAKMAAAQKKIAARPEVRARKSEIFRTRMADPVLRAKQAEYASIREYVFTDPQGVVYETRNLRGFCRDHGLNERCVKYILSGRYTWHKGWACRYK